jgi:hypothetical protein
MEKALENLVSIQKDSWKNYLDPSDAFALEPDQAERNHMGERFFTYRQ